jgi:hypothetical protein
MTTALDLIKRSMRLLGVYSIGEEPSADEAATGLTALNALTDSLANSGLLVYAKSLDTIALTANQASYTVGPSGATVTGRPVQVLDASTVSYQSVDYQLSVWTLEDYNSISVKTIGGIPGGLFPQMDMPDITLYLWPVPSTSGMTLNLWTNKTFTTFPALTTTVSLPPGYEQMLPFLLAEVLAPEYQTPVPAAVAGEAARIRRNLKRTNTQVPRLDMPYGIPNGNGWTTWQDY